MRTPPNAERLPHGGGSLNIANLPREIREQLNWRINDDAPGIDLVEWLNAKPEVQAVMKEHYDGRLISEQNLSEWRKYGYQKWLSLHIVLDEALAISEDVDQIAETGVNCEKLLLALTASYGAMIQNWNVMPAEQLIYKMGIFKNLTTPSSPCDAPNAPRGSTQLLVAERSLHGSRSFKFRPFASNSNANASNCSAKRSAINPPPPLPPARPRPPKTPLNPSPPTPQPALSPGIPSLLCLPYFPSTRHRQRRLNLRALHQPPRRRIPPRRLPLPRPMRARKSPARPIRSRPRPHCRQARRERLPLEISGDYFDPLGFTMIQTRLATGSQSQFSEAPSINARYLRGFRFTQSRSGFQPLLRPQPIRRIVPCSSKRFDLV